MDNQIRHFRRQRGMTLQALGDAIGLTPQSVSRIETGKMRLSTGWMALIARALRVRPVDLIEPEQPDSAHLAGEVTAGGDVIELAPAPFRLALPAAGALVFRMRDNCGPYRQGEYLVCEPLPSSSHASAIGHDCLVEAAPPAANKLLARVTAISQNGQNTIAVLTPLNSGGRQIENAVLGAVAPVRLRLQIVGGR